MLDAARYNNVFFSGTRHCVLQLGQKIVTGGLANLCTPVPSQGVPPLV